MRKIKLAALAGMTAAIAITPLWAQSGAPYTVVETGKGYARLQDAVNAIGNGRGTVQIASGRFRDCAVQEAGDVTFAAAVAGQSVLEGEACEDKAALVLRGRTTHVEGLVFANIKSGSGNGAGIRAEKGLISVSQSWFRDSQQGILSADDPNSTLTVDKSTFTRLGTCEFSAGCAHSIYVGGFGALTVTRSRFEIGRGGHYVKSRAAKVAVLASSFDDSQGKWTNYMIDLPAGATGKIAGNWFVRGQHKENYSAFIAVGAESKTNPSTGLRIEGNDARLVPGLDRDTVWVADWSGDRLAIGANTLGAHLKPFERR
ncbi:right-handed parallel beta-helix repeat-containing protein [Novosphingobium sp. MW5]|nr:right-handed parallel beta-helix repeat-containing protein [Novosphingobium sp. MW5]